MGTKVRTQGWAHRMGYKVGRAWRAYLRREQRVSGWLVTRGLSAGGVSALLWIVKLAVLGILFYFAFWIALLLLFASIVIWVLPHDASDPEDEHASIVPDEISELRKTPGYDPNLYNDTSHEMHEDD